MAILSVGTQPLVARGKPYPPGVGSAADAILNKTQGYEREVAEALRNFDKSLTDIHATLRQQKTVVDRIAVVDATGKVIAALGDFIFGGVHTTNYFSELHAGDPLNTGDPSQALFNANTDGSVTIGQHGWLDVLDPYDADAAWIGTQFDTLPVIGAVNNGAGLIRITVTAHTLVTGDSVQVRLVEGVTSATDGTSNANGTWTVTVIDANHVDLQNSVFVGTYTSGGTIDRLLHISGVANNGSGLARITTAVAHTYESGDRVHLAGVGSGLNGEWTIVVIDATHFDLTGSAFTGGTNGTSLRFFAGGLFQTIAIGQSFPNYNLRAFADGSLRLRNATIILSGPGGTITLDPLIPSITVKDSGGNQWAALEVITESPLTITAATNAGPVVVTINAHGYVNGDTIIVAGATGNTAINGYRIVEDVTANTFTMTSIAGAAVNGNGAYAGTATATRYYGGGLFQTLAIGSSFGNYKLRAFADGSLRLVNAELTLTSGLITVTINGTDFIKMINSGSTVYSQMQFDRFFVGITSNAFSYAQLERTQLKMSTTSAIYATLDSGAFEMHNAANATLITANSIDVDGSMDANTYSVAGVAGINLSTNFGTSVTVNTSGSGVFGTPGVGQSNGTVVTGVTLNLTARTWSRGILTA